MTYIQRHFRIAGGYADDLISKGAVRVFLGHPKGNVFPGKINT